MSKSRLSALAGYRAGFLPNPTLAMQVRLVLRKDSGKSLRMTTKVPVVYDGHGKAVTFLQGAICGY